MNPYDPCVANQMINGLKNPIIFHVDDLKMSHKYPKVNEIFIWVLREEYKSILEDGYSKMQVNHGKFHNYLDMKLDYTTVRQLKIAMLDYLNEIIITFDKADPTGGVTKPSASTAIFLW